MNHDPQERFNRRRPRAHVAPRTPGRLEDEVRGELWGLCDLCERWYFVAFEPALDVRSPRCPGCGAVADQLSLRVASSPGQ